MGNQEGDASVGKKNVVIYHADCPDGFGAAWACWTILGDDAEYIPAKYGDPVPDSTWNAEAVYIVDFSYPRPILEELAKRVPKVVVLDHHRTAQADLTGLPFATFDMEKSGAVMAWEHFHPNDPVPLFLLYIQDRDLWRWELPRSREFSAALWVQPREFPVWSLIASDFGDEAGHESRLASEFLDRGEAILDHVRVTVDRLVGNAKIVPVGGHPVPVVNSPVYQSELGEALCKAHPDRPFAAVYYKPSTGVEVWSLRSRNGFDVSEVAKSLGGGGHKAAAGFTVVTTPE